MNKRKISFVALLAPYLLWGLTGDEVDKYQHETKSALGANYSTQDNNGTFNDKLGKIRDSQLDSVIWEDLHKKESHNRNEKAAQETSKAEGQIKLAAPATKMAEYIANLEQNASTQRQLETARKKAEEKNKANPSYFVGGYCSVPEDINIIKNSEFVSLNCLLDFGSGEYRDAMVFAGVYPNYEKETLTILPIYANFANNNKSSFDGVVMTRDRGSLNIADIVERRRIKKLVAKYGLAINDVAYRYASMYLQYKMQSNVKTSVNYITTETPNGGAARTPIYSQEMLPPKAQDFWAMAGVELVSRIFAIGAEDLLNDSSPLFTIYKGKRVWIEGVVGFSAGSVGKRFGLIRREDRQNTIRDNATYKSRDKRYIQQSQSINNANENSMQNIMDSGQGSTGQSNTHAPSNVLQEVGSSVIDSSKSLINQQGSRR